MLGPLLLATVLTVSDACLRPACAAPAPVRAPPQIPAPAHVSTPAPVAIAAPMAGPIAPQPLARALREFARQSGLQFVYVAEVTRGRRTRGVPEALPADRALAVLLAGTGLAHEYVNARTVEIVHAPVRPAPAPAERTAALATVASLDVTVSARKRPENVLAVPLSITVVPGTTLTRFGIADFQDLQLYAPGFVVTPTPANSFVFVRGIGTQGNVLAFESSVALFVDGVYGGRNRQLQNPPFLDVARVEVLRGPQGALFGRNTSAGAVSVTTARPTPEPEGWLQADYEFAYGARSLTGVVSGPLSPRVQWRLAARLVGDPGFIDNVALGRHEPDRRDVLARLSFAAQPTDALDLYGRLDHGDTELDGSPFEFVPGGGRPRRVKSADGGIAPEHDDSRSLDAMLQADWRRQGHTVTGILARTTFRYDNAINIQARTPTLLVVENAEDFRQESLELRWLSPAGAPLDWVLGGYADRARTVLPARSTSDFPFVPGSPDGLTERRYLEHTDSRSLFGQLTWRVARTVDLTGGVRYTAVDKDGSLTRRYEGFAPGARDTPLAFRLDESFVDPSAQVQWEFAPGWRAFASFARGSKSGGSNGPTSTDTIETYTYGPERSRSFEAGVKGSAGRGTLGVVAFETQYRDLQKSVLDSATAGFVTRNAAAARSRGVELEAALAPAPTLRTSLSVAWLDGRFTDFPGARCPYGDPGAGVEGASCNLRGRPLTSAPKWGIAATAALDRPLTAALRLIGDAAVLHRGDVEYQPSYHPLERQAAFTKVDLRVGLASADDAWSAMLLVRNATNANTSSLVFETLPLLIDRERDRVHVPDRPRTWTLQLRHAFR
jgi:iron complex outermembrane receptor protein